MGYVVSTTAPASEPLTLTQVKNYLRVDSGFTGDDDYISGLISAAREHAERITGKCLAQRTMRQVMDSFPYYTDTIQSQLAYPPSYYSLPLYSSTLWNYSQMIKLFYGPVISVQGMRYIDPDGNPQTLNQDADFTLDRITMPARIFPAVGAYWPPSLYVANSLEIDYTAGYTSNPAAGPDEHTVGISPPNQQPDSIIMPGIPFTVLRILYMLIAWWYDHRSSEAPPEIDSQLAAEAVIDFSPSRG